MPSRLTAREIADELHISINTLKYHLKTIYRKLGVRFAERGRRPRAADGGSHHAVKSRRWPLTRNHPPPRGLVPPWYGESWSMRRTAWHAECLRRADTHPDATVAGRGREMRGGDMAGQGVRNIQFHPPACQDSGGRSDPPPLPPHTVVRTRLFDAFERGHDQPLTLVSAPAGTGKTVAVASWLAHATRCEPTLRGSR